MLRTTAVVLIALGVSATPPTTKLYENYNQALNVINPGGTSNGGTVRFLLNTDNVADCQKACISSTKARCWSFVHLKAQTPAYQISVLMPGEKNPKTLHANDHGDDIVSVRFQTHDDFSRYFIDMTDPASTVIRVEADKHVLHADDEGSDIVSTLKTSTPGDDYR